jgi:hypothetical protein
MRTISYSSSMIGLCSAWWIGFCLIAAASLRGDNIAITVQPNITPTQAIVQYTATSTGSCMIAVSDQSGLGVTVWDLDGSTFANANIDTGRPDTIQDGMNRTVILGHRSVEKGLDGLFYSRALQANTQHFVTVACGSDSGSATFTTQNIPFGGSYPELPIFDSQNTWNYAYPTIDYTIAGKEHVYIDPLTGAAVKRVTGPGDSYARLQAAQSFVAAKDLSGGAWNNPRNALQFGTANYASSSTVNAKLLISWGNIAQYGATYGGFGADANLDSIDDLLLRLNAGSSGGTAAISVCISIDGQTCYSAPFVLTPSSTNMSSVTLPQSGFPNVPWQSWGGRIPPRHLLTGAAVMATVNGTNVSLAAPDYRYGVNFDTEWTAGMPILVSGSSSVCPNNVCTLASVNSTVSLTLVENLGNISSQQQIIPLGGGVLVWKSSGSGTVFLNANFDVAHSGMLYLDGSNGLPESCSRVSDTTTVNADGTSINGSPQTGFLCKFGEGTVYFFDTDTGSARYLSNNFFRAGNFAGNFTLATQPFDFADSRSWYSFLTAGDAAESIVFWKSRYTGNFSSNPPAYPPSAEPGNITQSIFTALAPNDIGAKFAALIAGYPSYKTSLFGSFPNFVGFHPSGFAIFASGPGQDSAAWLFPFNMAAQQFTGALDSYSHTGSRWASVHTLQPTGDKNYSWISASPLRGNGNPPLSGPYQLPITQVWRSTDGVTGTWDTNTCVANEVTPVDAVANSGGCVSSIYAYNCPPNTSAYWTGAGQNNCIRVRTLGEPCEANATQTELAAFPCPWDGTQSMLQTAQVGDLIMDATTSPGCRDCEQLRIVQKTILLPNLIEFWLYRQAFPYPYPFTLHGNMKFVHKNGWQPRMANEGFDNVPYWTNLSNPVVWYPDTYLLQGGHADLTAAHPNGTFATVGGSGALIPTGAYVSRGTVKLPGDFGTLNNIGYGIFTPAFDNSAAGELASQYLETYISGKQIVAPDSEKTWILDWRTPQNAEGVAGESPQQIWPNTVSGPVAGTSNVYTITNPFPLDVKRHPLFGYAGRWRLQDISGPSSLIADTNTFAFCYAYFAGECRPGSTAGTVYVNVPRQEAQGCLGNQMSISSPCVFTAQSLLGYGTQTDVSLTAPVGTRFRRITGLFQPPGRSSHFEHLRSSPDGRWAFYYVNWAGAYRNEIFAVRLPPFPASDSVDRTTWTKTTIPIAALPPNERSSGRQPSGRETLARIKFGYDSQFHCSSRNEACFTDSSGSQPFLFGSEFHLSSQAASCSSGCSLNIPAISGRLLYYSVERLLETRTGVAVSIQGQVQVTLVP